MVRYCDRPLCVINFCFKRLLQNSWMKFEIISQECSLGDPLPKLLKMFCSVEQDGRQNLNGTAFLVCGHPQD